MAGSMMCVYCTARNASAGSTCWWQETQNQRGQRVVSPSHRDRAQNQDTKFHELPASTRGSCLYFGLRSLLGTITLPALTGPTRSRAMARTSFRALNFFAFLAIDLMRRHERLRYARRQLVERHDVIDRRIGHDLR